MKMKSIFLVCFLFVMFNSILFSKDQYNKNWPNWRGPLLTGEALDCTPPTEWSETKNVKWKTPIPGKGQSSPVIWGDQVFITTAIELDKKATEEAIKRLKKTRHPLQTLFRVMQTPDNFIQFIVYSVNRNNGEINWKRDCP